MNVDTLNSKYKVVSKYFVSKTVMDESLSDFKEKKSFKVKNKKAPPAKPKAKKVKQVKGQKDIRTVLKAKKNELIAYSEDFDSICKKSGIDVDSEQLQLAIALSKSLQTEDSAESSKSSSKSLTTQQRTGLIRTTLKEYGFKVPEKPSTTRKTKKRRKPYKLLLTSIEEKQQIISDRYSQILFELNSLKTTSSVLSNKDLVLSNLCIYNMATNIDYENIKDDAIFYVENIVEESPNNMGCLLKNWSDIPGRISSPDVNKSELLFSEVECSQEELDVVLSGPLKNSKDIIKKKNMLKDRGKRIECCSVKRNIHQTFIRGTEGTDFVENNTDNHTSPVFLKENSDNNIIATLKCNESSTKEDNREENNLLFVTQPSRSLSPDLFDDEDDTIAEIPNETVTQIETEPVINITKQTSVVMDLTECVTKAKGNMYNSSNIKPLSQLSQEINVTKRKSNDFMEMTECVGGSSQRKLEKIDDEIDLTGHCENLGGDKENNRTDLEIVEVVEFEGYSSQSIGKKVDDPVDLTAEFGSYLYTKENRQCKEICSTDVFLEGRTDDHIDLTGNDVPDIHTKDNSVNADNVEHMDLTQSSSSSNDTLPFVYIGGTQKLPEKSLDDTIILNETDYPKTNSPLGAKELHYSDDEQPKPDENIAKSPNNTIDMIASKQISVETEEAPIINLDETGEVRDINNEDVDLTQTSDSNEAPVNISNNAVRHINNSSLGKKDDVSVDYDEALENMNSFPYYDNEHDDNDAIVTEEQAEPSNDKEIFSNSNQEVLELSNNCLNSPPKITDNHFDFGGISVIDNVSMFNNKSRNTMSSIPNGSMSDSLPIVHVKRTCPGKPKSSLSHGQVFNQTVHENLDKEPNNGKKTPQTKVSRNINVETPEQSEYIVKSDNVTPMVDYASMSTPERNRELDKYGLKPFKRKRAIQLLTHLYNQTHPYIESTEELPSPSKKRRTEHLSQPSSSKPSSISVSSTISTKSPRIASKSPRKTSRSPRKTSRSPRKASRSPRKPSRSPSKTSRSPNTGDGLNDSDKDNDLFMVTRELPVIRNIECDADDWVFQRREKAKLQTCRVPLHIAFHNFVSCRRRLHEAILRYEPVNIDVIHKELAASGHRYDPKELLKFLDKRCITVKTADNTKNNKRY